MKRRTLLQIFALLALIAMSSACNGKKQSTTDTTDTTSDTTAFITVREGQFVRNGEPYRFIGTNFWYGAILGSEGEGGNRDRLTRELDLLKEMGVDNLRILVGSDGPHGVESKAEPTLQREPGVYNDSIFAGLDFLLDELRKRDMVAILYLNNSWEWSGGYAQYLNWAGRGDIPVISRDGWKAYEDYIAQFAQDEKAHEIFFQYVRDVVSRTNRYSGIAYKDDPAIMSWQIGNEPRPFGKDSVQKAAFASWLAQTSQLIKSIDPNHLVSTGSEGKYGNESDMALFEQIHADPNIDYINVHIWPYNWRWVTKDSLTTKLDNAYARTREYLMEHMPIARKIGKPVVLEEFGYPRDGLSYGTEAGVTARDEYYKYVFDLVVNTTDESAPLAGCNFWGWAGIARPTHEVWQPGDDYTNDPPQEPQGLYSVFASDSSTVQIIRHFTTLLKNK